MEELETQGSQTPKLVVGSYDEEFLKNLESEEPEEVPAE